MFQQGLVQNCPLFRSGFVGCLHAGPGAFCSICCDLSPALLVIDHRLSLPTQTSSGRKMVAGCCEGCICSQHSHFLRARQ